MPIASHSDFAALAAIQFISTIQYERREVLGTRCYKRIIDAPLSQYVYTSVDTTTLAFSPRNRGGPVGTSSARVYTHEICGMGASMYIVNK